MLHELKELYRFRELLWVMVRRELKIRYKNTVIGFFWSLINPAVNVVIFTLVFKVILRNGIDNYSAYLLSAMLPFAFFSQSLMDCAGSILANLNIVRKVYFPREIFPISMVLSNFVHLLLSMGVFCAYLMLIWAIHPGSFPVQKSIVFLPVLMCISLCLTLGLGLWFSAVTVFFEDARYMLQIGLQVMFYMCPIIYFSEMLTTLPIPIKYQRLAYLAYHLNPVAELSQAYRKVLLAPMPMHTVGPNHKPIVIQPIVLDWRLVGITALVSVVALLAGYNRFNKMKWRFVERR